MKGLIFRHDSAGHRFERHTAILLHHLIHLGSCRLRLVRNGLPEETLLQCGLFIAREGGLHDPVNGVSVHPRQLPVAYLLPPFEHHQPLLRLENATGTQGVDILLPWTAWESEVLRHLVETLLPAPVDAAEIRSRVTTGPLIQAA